MKQLLGVKIQTDGKIIFENGDEEAGAELLERLMTAMGDKTFVETIVSNANQQEAFLKQFEPLAVKTVPLTGEKGDKGTGTKTGTKKDDEKKKVGGAGKDKKTKPRRYLADKGLDIELTTMSSFYDELRKLIVDKNKHVSAAMLRIFLDKATSCFLIELKIPHPGKLKWDDHSVNLKTKVAAVLKILDKTKKNKDFKYARNIADGGHGQIHTLDWLNDYIHHHKALPIPSEIITTWDRLHPYFAALFDHINAENAKNPKKAK